MFLKSTLLQISSRFPGIAFCSFVSLLSFFLVKQVPQVGVISFSLLTGVLLANIFNLHQTLLKGVSFCQKWFLEVSIILLGLNLSYHDLKIINQSTIISLVSMVILSIALSLIIGKIFRMPRSLSFLIGVGNAICGSAAILGSSKVIKAPQKDIASALTITNILGICSLFILPFFLQGYSDKASGFLVGGSLQAMGHVIASTSLLNSDAGHYAVTIKMARIFLLTPLIFILSLSQPRTKKGLIPCIPLYIVGFLCCIFIANMNWIPTETMSIIKKFHHYLLATAMAALGLSLKFSQVFHKISRNLLFAVLIFALQITFLLMVVKFQNF